MNMTVIVETSGETENLENVRQVIDHFRTIRMRSLIKYRIDELKSLNCYIGTVTSTKAKFFNIEIDTKSKESEITSTWLIIPSQVNNISQFTNILPLSALSIVELPECPTIDRFPINCNDLGCT